MRRLIATAAMLLGAALIAAPVTGQGETREPVTFAFQLTIHGDPPPHEGFLVRFNWCQGVECRIDTAVDLFCGDPPSYDWPEFKNRPSCEGGMTYTLEQELSRPLSSVHFQIIRGYEVNRASKEEYIARRSVGPVAEGDIYSTSYTYPGAGDEQVIPDVLPDTGVGGMAGAGAGMRRVALVARAAVVPDGPGGID